MSDDQVGILEGQLSAVQAQLEETQRELAALRTKHDAAMHVVDAVQAFLNKNGIERWTHRDMAEALAQYGYVESRTFMEDGRP